MRMEPHTLDMVTHQSQKIWLSHDCPYVHLHVQTYLPNMHIYVNQCEISLCKNLVPKVFPLEIRRGRFTALGIHVHAMLN